MQELIYLIWHGRKQLLNPIAILRVYLRLRVKREPARGSESPAAGCRRAGLGYDNSVDGRYHESA
jgi:hypothetical protein